MRAAIDIGHGLGRDMGAVAANGLSEHAYWTEHAPKVIQKLESLGVTARIFKRATYGSVSGECKAINDWNADVAVSLHLNSASSSAQGHEVIHYSGSARGMQLARSISNELVSVLDSPNRGIKPPYAGRGDAFLSGVRAPAVIVEAGFLSSVEDTRRMMDRSGDIAAAIARGIYLYSI